MYTTVGIRSGMCLHEHTNREEAEECLNNYLKDCRLKGKISDRIVVETTSLDELRDEMVLY